MKIQPCQQQAVPQENVSAPVQRKQPFLNSSITQNADETSSSWCGAILACLKGILDAILKFFGCGEKEKEIPQEKKPEQPKPQRSWIDPNEEKEPIRSDFERMLDEADTRVQKRVTADEQQATLGRAIRLIEQGTQKITSPIFERIIECYSQPFWSVIFEAALATSLSQECIDRGFGTALKSQNLAVTVQLYARKSDLNSIFKKEPALIAKMVEWRVDLEKVFCSFFSSKTCDVKIRNDALAEAIKLALGPSELSLKKTHLDTASELINFGADSKILVQALDFDGFVFNLTAEQWINRIQAKL